MCATPPPHFKDLCAIFSLCKFSRHTFSCAQSPLPPSMLLCIYACAQHQGSYLLCLPAPTWPLGILTPVGSHRPCCTISTKSLAASRTGRKKLSNHVPGSLGLCAVHLRACVLMPFMRGPQRMQPPWSPQGSPICPDTWALAFGLAPSYLPWVEMWQGFPRMSNGEATAGVYHSLQAAICSRIHFLRPDWRHNRRVLFPAVYAISDGDRPNFVDEDVNDLLVRYGALSAPLTSEYHL